MSAPEEFEQELQAALTGVYNPGHRPPEIVWSVLGLGDLEDIEALWAALTRAIEELRPEYKELVLLRHFGGLSYQEIAEFKEMPLGTIKNKLFRAHSVLRKALQAFL